MPQASISYILSNIFAEIPSEILQLAFKPRQNATTIEQRIIEEIIEGPILLDTNLIAGRRRNIIVSPQWRMCLNSVESYGLSDLGIGGSYYLIPPEARENRNIASVIGVMPEFTTPVPGGGVSTNGMPAYGNTATGMLSAMLDSRTFANTVVEPEVTLEGTNIIRFYPEPMVDGYAVSIMLEFDSEFLNLGQSAILALRELCLCATQRYIGNVLRVAIDETEVVAGLEIGVIRTIVDECIEKGKEYKSLLIKFKGASHLDTRTLSRLMYHAM